MPMTKNKLTPLELLRQEKEVAKRECVESEARLAEHWSYLSDNASSLIFQSAINGVLRHFGFGPKEKNKDGESSGIANNGFLGAFTAYYPVIWELVQPMLIRFVIRKVKSIFSRKKNKKQRDEDD